MKSLGSRVFSFCLLLCLYPSGKLLASGITLHMWMAEKGAASVSIPELQDFLNRHEAAYKNGSVFPDSGYVIQHPYGEYAHWSGFLNAYYAVILKFCPVLTSDECAHLFAHFLGSLAHTVSDINFDRHFVQEEARRDFGGNLDEAQKYTDPGLDFLAILEHKRGFKIPDFHLPAGRIVDVFAEGGEVSASEVDLHKANQIVRLGLIGEPLGAPFAYLYYKGKMPWASQNYMGARGGVEDTAARIARAWEIVWLAYQRNSLAEGTLFRNQGQWPNVDFFVDGRSLETL